MRNIEDELKNVSEKMSKLKAPLEMEDRLRSALSVKRRLISFKWMSIAASLILLFVIGMNYQALAFYGKKIVGFDDIVYGSLKDVNELGMGQVFNKTVPIDGTTQLTIDGIVNDDNQMIVYFTVTSTDNLNDKFEVYYPREVTGWLTNNHSTWSTGMVSDDGTEYKGIASFEPPNMFAKNLTFHFLESTTTGQKVSGSITVPYNVKEAIRSVVKQKINKTIEVDRGKITFNSITASAMSTTVAGTIDVDNFDRLNLGVSNINLLADGVMINQIGSSVSSSLTGKKNFEINYEGLPEGLESLQLHVDSFVGYKEVNAEIQLATLESEWIDLERDELRIKEVQQSGNQTEITIASEDTFLLDGVSVGVGEEITPLETTINHTETKTGDGTILRVRTMVFPTSNHVETLYIKGFHYEKRYNIIVDIPVK